MNVDNLLELSSETNRLAALNNALKSIGDMDIILLNDVGWFDDMYDTSGYPEDEMHDGESWLDDLEEAA